MQRIKCDIRAAREADRSMLVLLAEETLHPLADGSGHPERYHTRELVELLGRADVYVAEARDEPAGFVALETEQDALTVRCICVSPAFEAQGVANQLLDWAEGLAIDRRLVRLVAHVPEDDAPSLHLYRGHGFGAKGTGTEDRLTLEKPLPGSER